MVDPGTPTSNNIESIEEEVIHTCCSHNFPPICMGDRMECMCMHYVNQNTNKIVDMQADIKNYKQTIECKRGGLLKWIKQRPLELVTKKSTYTPCELYKLNICNQNADGCVPKVI